MIKYETYSKDKFATAVSQLPYGYTEGNRAPDSMFGCISRAIQCVTGATGPAHEPINVSCGKRTRHMGTLTHRTGHVPGTGAKIPFFAHLTGITARLTGTIARIKGRIDYIAQKRPHITGTIARLMGSFARTMRIKTDFILPSPVGEGYLRG